MPKGKVQEYDAQSGSGRIIDSATNESLIVYANYIDGDAGQALEAGQTVDYQIEYHRQENWAVYVRIVPSK